MKENNKNYIVSRLENGLMTEVSKLINKHLGVEIDLKMETSFYPWNGWHVALMETGDATTKILTSTPLLSQLFKKSKLEVQVGYNEEHHEAWFRVMIGYDHNFGRGSNGNELMVIIVNPETFEIIELRK